MMYEACPAPNPGWRAHVPVFGPVFAARQTQKHIEYLKTSLEGITDAYWAYSGTWLVVGALLLMTSRILLLPPPTKLEGDSAGPVRAVGKVVNPLLPCPAAGFYSHPTNCSRFYRCVDHSGSGRFFVRHVFECPAVIFAESLEVLVMALEALHEEAKPLGHKLIYCDCEGPYLQHEKYCNVYRRCNDTVQRYICPLGTVFDQSRQMCRISAADEVLCAGKTIAQLPLFLRAEVVEGHILLPHDFILRPLRHFLTQPLQHTLRNQGPQGLPGGHPSVYHNPQGSSFFGVPPSGLPAPYHSLPADTIPVFSQPLAASYPYSGYYSGFDPTVESSVNNVRRPEGHLHGGYYSSYDPTVESSVNNVRRPQGHLHSGYYSRFDAPVESSVSNVRRPDGPLHFPGYSHYNPGMYYPRREYIEIRVREV
ncbi:hypothetical protein GWK47_022413 [Chionoecetes opilio]|uniref:Chitin-binding type-2 domain-containing protein n=1 Tax=Chionoecetes opilio TaxID=41210 RepID=A0A8J5CK62_CHIOP|nr:hypothetical protein GWK47_022413 [Chionoecetes opilio]